MAIKWSTWWGELNDYGGEFSGKKGYVAASPDPLNPHYGTYKKWTYVYLASDYERLEAALRIIASYTGHDLAAAKELAKSALMANEKAAEDSGR
jgi:hypothetical protein